MKALVIIPTLNEENNIEIIINRIIFFHKKIKILVVDDESKDNTINIVKNYEVFVSVLLVSVLSEESSYEVDNSELDDVILLV